MLELVTDSFLYKVAQLGYAAKQAAFGGIHDLRPRLGRAADTHKLKSMILLRGIQFPSHGLRLENEPFQ